MSNNKHKLKKKRRHERQIAEGTRIPVRCGKRKKVATPTKRVYLSDIDSEDVRAVLNAVRDLRLS